jgi:hypothetical protein
VSAASRGELSAAILPAVANNMQLAKACVFNRHTPLRPSGVATFVGRVDAAAPQLALQPLEQRRR